ncbi:SGNH/GDSL hydrolase family protein [Anditalea andensis]|uniref:Uncharacterized protein n=1 Tax=Anditalea andensis TaxID=1048983 RepID=A0A074KS93_9BACT|nr:hypothetical protein [Anditalea andensis]KEO71784.1 hypothetical protein EL17_21620 [Anditalea andensis]
MIYLKLFNVIVIRFLYYIIHRLFGGSFKIVNTLYNYIEAIRQVANEEEVRLIYFQAKSKILYELWEPDNSIKHLLIPKKALWMDRMKFLGTIPILILMAPMNLQKQ